MSHFTIGRALAATLSAVALAAGALAAATPASALAGDPNMLGSLQTEFQSGPRPHVEKNSSGIEYWADWYGKLFTNEGEVCPAGTTRSNLLAFDTATGQQIGSSVASAFRQNVDYGENGDSWTLNSRTSIQRVGGYATGSATPFPGLVLETGGSFEIRHTCQTATTYVPATDKYFGVAIVMQPGGAWAVSNGTVEPPVKTGTTTTLAASGTTATSTTLTATVAPTAATGTVTFTGGSLPVEGVQAAVTNGSAMYSVSGLTGATAYSFIAEYSGDATHASSVSPAEAVTTATPAPTQDTAAPAVNVEVPGVTPTTKTGLSISVDPADSIRLTGTTPTRSEGEVWTATGQLGAVTVNDDRRGEPADGWTLNGRSSAFMSGDDSIPATNFSWAPKKVSGAGTEGPAASSLATEQRLAAGLASTESNVTTTVNADLTLTVPATAPGGSYAATLTLTLI